ncbi:MAG: RagB/SusD family nutrient uptake outer membrane protein [Prevotellaceae bacterium]|jgi:hypothetical protein|nr:RagB/SusD family nutrient uptake outer membrane protein [Prevotellaceae bacterium]
MKTRIKYTMQALFCLTLLFVANSCSDFLDEKPKNSMTTNQYFTSPDHARSTVNALYRRGAPEFNNATDAYLGTVSMYGGYMSGLFESLGAGGGSEIGYVKALTLDSKNIAQLIDRIWDPCYNAIARANTAIKYVPTTPGLSDAEKKSLLAQSLFFRAYNYFALVKTFGDVPLVLEPYESLDNLYLPRTPSADIYARIETDLKDAIAGGGLNNAAFTDNGFRISKTTAETVLATVYLQWSGYPLNQNRYADAATLAKSVIAGGKHRLMTNDDRDMNSAYNKLRTLDASPEYIYTYEFALGISDASWWPTYAFYTQAAGWGVFQYAILENIYKVSDAVLNAYEPTDLRFKERQFFFRSYSYEKNGATTNVEFPYVCNWLYYDEEALLNTGKGTKDITVIRYPEVLLIAAEALVKTANSVGAEAAGYLADVKARASTTETKAEILAPLLALSPDAFVREVWAERLREFALECKVWDDIKRTRMYPRTSAANKGEVTFVNVVGAVTPLGATFKAEHLLWPISDNEIQRNPALLPNNPGY